MKYVKGQPISRLPDFIKDVKAQTISRLPNFIKYVKHNLFHDYLIL